MARFDPIILPSLIYDMIGIVKLMQVVKLTSHLRLNLHMHHRVKYT